MFKNVNDKIVNFQFCAHFYFSFIVSASRICIFGLNIDFDFNQR